MNEDDVEEERERLVENWMELCSEGERRIYGDEEGEVTAPVGDEQDRRFKERELEVLRCEEEVIGMGNPEGRGGDDRGDESKRGEKNREKNEGTTDWMMPEERENSEEKGGRLTAQREMRTEIKRSRKETPLMLGKLKPPTEEDLGLTNR